MTSIYQTLIKPDELSDYKNQQDLIVIDCRYDLNDVSSAYRAYLEAHIAGAVYADIQKHLSGEPRSDHGRHPLPAADKLRAVFSAFGIDNNKQVVAYDTSSGAFAARLWWLLHYMGHDAAAVLDGGWPACSAARLEVAAGPETRPPAKFAGEPRREWLVTINEVAAAPLLVDSREAARYRGELEPLDPVAGHIPGAINHCWKENLGGNGCFLQAEQLRRQFRRIFTDIPAEQVVFYCGSGVTACHNLLAVMHAGLPAAKLYAGSWSEWCRDADRAVATGPEPA